MAEAEFSELSDALARSSALGLQHAAGVVASARIAPMRLQDSGGARRSHLRGLLNVTKSYLLAAPTHNPGRILRKLTGIGKPKTLQGSGGEPAPGFCPAPEEMPNRRRSLRTKA